MITTGTCHQLCSENGFLKATLFNNKIKTSKQLACIFHSQHISCLAIAAARVSVTHVFALEAKRQIAQTATATAPAFQVSTKQANMLPPVYAHFKFQGGP